MVTLTVSPGPAPITGADRTEAQEWTVKAIETAAEHGWKATAGPHKVWFVASAHEPRIARTVEIVRGQDDALWFSCTCPSGYYRGMKLPVVCWHAAAVAALLYEDGWATVRDGLFSARDRRRAPNGRFMARSGRPVAGDLPELGKP